MRHICCFFLKPPFRAMSFSVSVSFIASQPPLTTSIVMRYFAAILSRDATSIDDRPLITLHESPTSALMAMATNVTRNRSIYKRAT